MSVFLDALSDAWSQMTGTLAYVAQAFGENWRTGLAALLARPAALFYVVGVVAVLALALKGLTAENRVGYRRGRFLSANEKILLRTLDAALGRNYRAFAQVRLAEIANPADSANVHLRRRALNAVMAKSVDFVICAGFWTPASRAAPLAPAAGVQKAPGHEVAGRLAGGRQPAAMGI